MKQLSFLNKTNHSKTTDRKIYGGSLVKGSRKTRRPLDSKKPIHLILKATNSFSLLRNKKQVESTIHKMSQRFGIKIYSLGIQADHIHLNIKVVNRTLYVKWIRALTGTLAKSIQKLKFKFLPFTRVGYWGPGFKTVQTYIFKNRIEGEFLLESHRIADKKANRVRLALLDNFTVLNIW